MHVLLTNDDGIHAPGIRALADGLIAAGHRVSVCAPDRERSGASHSATIQKSLRAVAVDYPGAERAWAVEGTPSDCASLGLWLVREDPVDLVIAGINWGMNMGGACVYSGTVGAAMEAAMGGTPGLAVSLAVNDWRSPADFTAAARLAVKVAEWAVRHPLPLGCIYNLNVPPIPYEAIKGVVPARLAPVFLGAPHYEAEAGGMYHFIKKDMPPLEDLRGDVRLVAEGYATVTKLTWDMRMGADDAELAEIEL